MKESVQGFFSFLPDPTQIIRVGGCIETMSRCSKIETLHLLKIRAQNGLAGNRYSAHGEGETHKFILVCRVELQFEAGEVGK